MVTEDRNLRLWRAWQPWWLLLAVSVLTVRGESPPAAGQTMAATAPSAGLIGAARKQPAKMVRPDREARPAGLAQAPAEFNGASVPADSHAPGVIALVEDVRPTLAEPAIHAPSPASSHDGSSEPAGQAEAAAPSNTAQPTSCPPRSDGPWSVEGQPAAAPPAQVDRAMLLAAARQHTDEAVRVGNQRNFGLAREKFIEALRELTMCSQNASGQAASSTPWSEVLIALEEADDFVGSAGGQQPVAPAALAAGHCSRAAATLPPQATPREAALHYARFASQRLIAGLAPSREASRALLGLGKVHALMADQSSPAIRNGLTKAHFFYEAALRMDDTNWRAASELGMLLARQKQFAEAVAFLRQSVAIEPRAETLHHLAVALRGAGQESLAREADQRSLDLGFGRPTAPPREATPSLAAATQPSPVAATAPASSPEAEYQAHQASDESKPSSNWKAAPVPGEKQYAKTATTPSAAGPSKKAAQNRGLFWWLQPNWK